MYLFYLQSYLFAHGLIYAHIRSKILRKFFCFHPRPCLDDAKICYPLFILAQLPYFDKSSLSMSTAFISASVIKPSMSLCPSLKLANSSALDTGQIPQSAAAIDYEILPANGVHYRFRSKRNKKRTDENGKEELHKINFLFLVSAVLHILEK